MTARRLLFFLHTGLCFLPQATNLNAMCNRRISKVCQNRRMLENANTGACFAKYLAQKSTPHCSRTKRLKTARTLPHRFVDEKATTCACFVQFCHIPCQIATNTKNATRVLKTANCNCWVAHAPHHAQKPKMHKKRSPFQMDFLLFCCYQITTRLDGARYILSVFLTLNVLYHSGKLRGCMFARSIAGP